MNTNLKEKVLELISSSREGDYWDFKETHHANKANLLHDILCLANSVNKTNKLLIYGVSDPSSDCKIKGLDQTQVRRSQTDIIDFIRSKNFAGEIKPEVELRTISIEGLELDILIIFDRPQKPYTLKEDYRDGQKVVKASHIYTRILDANTPINQSADLVHVEAMWRERLGLDLQPAERMLALLKKPHEWESDIGNQEFSYHKYHPEYRVRCGDVKEFPDVYSYFYINPTSFFGEASFYYLTTELFKLNYIYCDEMRVALPAPGYGYLRTEGREIRYMYYELNGKNGAFLSFLTNGTFDFQSRGSEASFILFRNREERENFETWLKSNLNRLDSIPDSDFGKSIQGIINRSKQKFAFSPVEMMKVYEMHRVWQSTNRA